MATDNQQTQPDKPLFLYISPARLILLSIATLGLYEIYWVYKNWRYIKERDGLNISPFWRGVFGIFFCHSLLRRIHEDQEARSIQVPAFSPGGLATGWVILIITANIVGRAPSIVLSIISAVIPSFLCLVPVQNYINTITVKRNPGQKFYRWSAGHMVCLVIGIISWVLHLIGPGVDVSVLTRSMGRAKQKVAHIQIETLQTTLNAFYLDVGRYPTTDEGLNILIANASKVSHRSGPYLTKTEILIDPWNNPYHYKSPGDHGEFDLYSYGADNKEGGDGENSDIVSW